MEIKEEIPDYVLDIFYQKYEMYPNITNLGIITSEGQNQLLQKNSIVWYNRKMTKLQTIYYEVVLNYGDRKVLLYLSKSVKENTYKIFALSDLENENIIKILINGLNKFFTID